MLAKCSECNSTFDSKSGGVRCVLCGRALCPKHESLELFHVYDKHGSICEPCVDEIRDNDPEPSEPPSFKAEIYWDRSIPEEEVHAGEFICVHLPAGFRTTVSTSKLWRDTLILDCKHAFRDSMLGECAFVRLEDECKECSVVMTLKKPFEYECPMCGKTKRIKGE